MVYVACFMLGVLFGFITLWFSRRKIDYPGELVITKDDGMYLAVGEDFKDRIRHVTYVTLKLHRL